MINKIWDEIAYRRDICLVSREKHIEEMWTSVDNT
jgi:hypothetical protein